MRIRNILFKSLRNVDALSQAAPSVDKIEHFDSSFVLLNQCFANRWCYREYYENMHGKKKVWRTIRKRSLKSIGKESLDRALIQRKWESLGEVEDVNVMAEHFTDYVRETLDELAPIRVMKISNQFRHGLTEETKAMMYERNCARLRVMAGKRSERPQLWKEYTKIRNKCTRGIRKDTQKATVDFITNAHGQQNVWKVVNSMTRTEDETNIKLVGSGGDTVEDGEIPDVFNRYFVNKIQTLHQNIPNERRVDPLELIRGEKSLKGETKRKFSINTVSEKTVRRHIRRLKNTKSYGHDEIPTEVLKKAGDFLVIPLTRIINTSIRDAVYPDIWKLAKIIPIHKRSERTNVENYRPISLLPIASKVLESVVQEQLLQHTERLGILPSSQHGFRPNRSTMTAALSMTTQWKHELKSNRYVGVLFFDLSSAFDTIDTEILCAKMEIMGLEKMGVKWIRSFMQGRRQAVAIGEKTSTELNMKVGCPQGSILSPLLFTIYISDMGL